MIRAFPQHKNHIIGGPIHESPLSKLSKAFNHDLITIFFNNHGKMGAPNDFEKLHSSIIDDYTLAKLISGVSAVVSTSFPDINHT